MSLFDKLSHNRAASVRRLIGAETFSGHGIRTYGGAEIVYFIVQPVNLAVLSRSTVQIRVNALMNLLKGLTEAEILCINSREDFEGNKAVLKARMEAERNDAVRLLLGKDLLFLDQIQSQTASAREFLLGLRFKREDDILPGISRVDKLLKEQGFFARPAVKDDLKRLFAVYFSQCMTVAVDDYDGERYANKAAGHENIQDGG